jgi:hypothetical protein
VENTGTRFPTIMLTYLLRLYGNMKTCFADDELHVIYQIIDERAIC